jgi:RNA polymerase sigma factor for flagellar operon FliA
VAAPAAAERWEQLVRRRDPQARDALIAQYAPLVKYVIGRMAIALPTILSHEDVLSYGTMGLVQAVDRYDPSVGVKFETYAIRRIRGSILDAIRSVQPLTRDAYRQAQTIERTYEALTHQLGRMPTDQEAAAHLGWTVDELRTAQVESSATFISLERSQGEPGDDGQEGAPLLFQLQDRSSPDVPDAVVKQELFRALVSGIEQLPERDRLVITLYYYESLTLREISEVLGVSTSRVSQIHAGALFKLKGALRPVTEEVSDP